MNRHLFASILGLAAAGTAWAMPAVHVLPDRSAEIEGRFLLREDRTQTEIGSVRLSGRAGERLERQVRLAASGSAWTVDLSVVPRSAGSTDACLLDLESGVRHLGEEAPKRTRRRLRVAEGRVALVDVWSDGGERGLVLALACRWEVTPRVAPVSGNAAPFSVVIELMAGAAGEPRLLERHLLTGLVGEPLMYAFGRSAGDGAAAARVELSIVPRSIDSAGADLDITLRRDGEGAYEGEASLDLSVREHVPAGASLDLPLPARPDGTRPFLRIRPVY
ncbi:MAG: hypothetical protein D6718_07280 [Acidobacteria bacterium]|nr:MAG: hypothetical protein D6718_07280 [Acidobacteriota bacterium]